MRLYVANTSQQNQIINYRMLESAKVHTQPIPLGRQVAIGGASADLDRQQVDKIIEQLSKYGLVGVGELGKAKGIIPYIYSVDNPVRSDAIGHAATHNRGVLSNRGKKFREEAAIAANGAIDTAIAEDHGGAPPLKGFEMSVEEENRGSLESDSDPVVEGYRRDFGTGKSSGRKRGR